MKSSSQVGTLIPAEILLVEDSPPDVLMTREALDQSTLLNNLHVVEDGQEAMDFLRNTGKHQNAPRPHIILLDLNMPRKSGREVLAEAKADPGLRLIPIVVLTTSTAEADVLDAYGLHANSYVTKPVEFENFVQAIRSIEHFWFEVVTLPNAT